MIVQPGSAGLSYVWARQIFGSASVPLKIQRAAGL